MKQIEPESEVPPPVRVVLPGYGKIGERPLCPKNHRFRPISFDESTGLAIYTCKCGIQYERQAKFVCASSDDCEHEWEWVGGGGHPAAPSEPEQVCRHCGMRRPDDDE